MWGFFLSVSPSSLFSNFIKAGFGCCGFFRCGFYEIGLTGAIFFEYLGKNMMGTTCCGMVIRIKNKDILRISKLGSKYRYHLC